MKRKKALVLEAKKLVRLSLDATGGLSGERVQAILETLKASGRPILQLRLLLKAYQRFVQLELDRGQGLLECAGALKSEAVAALAQHLSIAAKRPVSLETRENPSLIAGVRVTLGDHVWESSISSRLATLSSAL